MAPHEPDLCNDDERNPSLVEIEEFGNRLAQVAEDAIAAGASLRDVQLVLASTASKLFNVNEDLHKRLADANKAANIV